MKPVWPKKTPRAKALSASAALFVALMVLTGCSLGADQLNSSEPFQVEIVANLKSNNLIAVAQGTGHEGEVSYQWFLNGSEIPGETSDIYLKKISDCGNNLQVRAENQSSDGTLSATSAYYNPEICEYTTGDLMAWPLLHTCNAIDGLSFCDEGGAGLNRPGAFQGTAYFGSRAQSWFRVPIEGLDPSKVRSWSAELKQVYLREGGSHSLDFGGQRYSFFAKNKIDDYKWSDGVFIYNPSPGETMASLVSEEVDAEGFDGAAYLGLEYDAVFLRTTASVSIETIRVHVKFQQ